jgi:hypothetical protein
LVTAASLCDALHHCDRGVSWNYYTPTRGVIWDATEAIPQVCYTTAGIQNVACNGYEWTHHVVLPDSTNHSDAPIFDDLLNCTLPAISWVIPDTVWSDHPQDHATATTTVYGPSWVGDIINAVGGGMAGSTCNPPSTTNAKYWKQEPTLVIVVWDDWGGWFDHVQPPNVYRSSSSTTCPTSIAPNGWGCGYTYGFRVPLLVVSPYTGTKNADGSYSGYISGPCGGSGQPSCPNNNFPFVHDFGSVLAFTEYNFGMKNITFPNNFYADYNALDWGSAHNHIPLSDFFPLTTARPFVSISTPKDYTFFRNYYATTGASPTGPDDDNAADQ